MSERPVPKGEMIDGEKFEAFLRWNERQTSMRFEMGAVLDNLIAWDDEYPEDERGVVDLSGTADNLIDLMQAFKEQVQQDTLKWVSEELVDALESRLDDEDPGVNWKAISEVMVQVHGWKEVQDDGTGEDEASGEEQCGCGN